LYQGLAWWEAVVVDKEEASVDPLFTAAMAGGGGGGGGRGGADGGGDGSGGLRLAARYKIHYPGWISRWDEWVDRSR
jgi:hypothetical protein